MPSGEGGRKDTRSMRKVSGPRSRKTRNRSAGEPANSRAGQLPDEPPRQSFDDWIHEIELLSSSVENIKNVDLRDLFSQGASAEEIALLVYRHSLQDLPDYFKPGKSGTQLGTRDKE